jgi:hypothetical protein
VELVRGVSVCYPSVGVSTDSVTAINMTDRSDCVFLRPRFECCNVFKFILRSVDNYKHASDI